MVPPPLSSPGVVLDMSWRSHQHPHQRRPAGELCPSRVENISNRVGNEISWTEKVLHGDWRIYEDPYEDLFEQVSQYQVERPNLNALLSVKALVCACNKEKAKENTFSRYCVNLPWNFVDTFNF